VAAVIAFDVNETLLDLRALDAPFKQVLGSVQASFLGAAFEVIDADYGNLETYLSDGIGLGAAERTALAARYLQA
jgi:protein tyrosine/serine phosphatase